MRFSGLAVLSPAHIPPDECDAIEALIIATAPIAGRQAIDYHGIAEIGRASCRERV